jgi:hypothetical protein
MTHRRLSVERLEDRLALSATQPTPAEQLFLERLNDARTDPAAYGASIGFDLSAIPVAQPLAFNTQLESAAHDEAAAMNIESFFAHVDPQGRDPGARIAATGFPYTLWAESIAGGTIYPTPESALAGLIVDAGIAGAPHRVQLLALSAADAAQGQIGVGVVQGGGGSMTNYYVADTGETADTRPFLTGVVFNDFGANGKYQIGEGLGGVTITASGNGQTLTTQTFGSGGYSLQVTPGLYTVTASGGGLVAPLTHTVYVGVNNVRINFAPQDDAYVAKLYRDDLGRTPSAGEVDGWVRALQGRGGAAAVASAIANSTEARCLLVRGWYSRYLGRAALPSEASSWAQAMGNGTSAELVQALILGSAEFAKRAAASNPTLSGDQAFVASLYQNLLGRTASAAEINNFVATLPTSGRGSVAMTFLWSAECRTRQTQADYVTLLHRSTSPSPAEVAGWVYSGLSQTTVWQLLEQSQEFFFNG